ncbi:hypothetical protein J4482_00970 [Candidatus Woesearchaeota archaeon]|nr:hypothetical protein [Candidatus Woesearchaeota archaeon]
MKIKKILETKQGEKYFIKDMDKDFHTKYGVIKKDDLKKTKDGEVILSDHHEECAVYSPSFIDNYRKIARLAQIPLLKDIGFVIAELGLGRDSVIIEGGSGSGGVACFLANLVKHVHTFDINDDNIKVVSQNILDLELKNIDLHKKSMYEDLVIKDIDAVFLDLPEPWNAVIPSQNALKIGGFLVSYSPNLTSVNEFVNSLTKNKSFSYIKTVEIIEQPWEVQDRKIKPISEKQHSGFLTIARKIKL